MVHGSLENAYRVLIRDGFTVSVPRGVVVGGSARVDVVGERPSAGSSVAQDSTVTLRVSSSGTGSTPAASLHVAGVEGLPLLVAERWAELRGIAWRVMVGPLRRGTRHTLLGNYLTRRAVLTPRWRIRHGRMVSRVLELFARQSPADVGVVVPARVSTCEPAANTGVLVSTATVVLVQDPGGTDPLFGSFVACDRATGQQKLLYQEEVSGDGYYYNVDGATATGDTVGLAVQFGDKYDDCSSYIEIYNFAEIAPLTTVSALCADVWSLAVDDEGFAAWLEPGPGPGPDGVFVHDDSGTRQLDSGTISNLNLSGATLTWTNNGTPHEATLS